MKKIIELIGAINLAVFTSATNVLASDWDVVSGAPELEGTSEIVNAVGSFVKPISAMLIFLSVIMVGFEIIMKRNKASERMDSMSSLMWLGIGALVIGTAGILSDFLFVIA